MKPCWRSDASGNIIAVNESAMLQLDNSNRAAFIGQPISNFFQFDFEILEQRASNEPSTIWPVRDVAHGRRFFALVRAPRSRTIRAATVKPEVISSSNGSSTARGEQAQQQYVGEDAQMRKNLICGRQLFAKQVPILLQGATGHRQGGLCQGFASRRPVVRQAFRDGELRGDSGKPHRERTVRLHARRIYRRRQGGPPRQDSAVQRRDLVSGRNRRHAADAADPIVARD